MTEFSTMMNPLTLEKSPGNDGQEEAMRGISDNLVAVQQKLDKLLATKDRPNISGSFSRKTCVRQVTVNLSINILRIENIDVPNQEFTTEFDLYVSWFQGERLETKQDIISDQNEWNPEIYFPNATHMDMIQKISSPETNDGCSEILYRVKGKFRCIFNFQDFPFDYQMLRIFVSSRWNRNIVQFRQGERAHPFVAIVYEEGEHSNYSDDGLRNSGHVTTDEVAFQIPISRKAAPFLWRHLPIFVICCLLVSATLFVDVSNASHRFIPLVLIFLLLVICRYITRPGNDLAHQNCTLFYKYILSLQVIVVLAILCSAFVSLTANLQIRRRGTFGVFAFIFLAFVIIHLVLLIISVKKELKRTESLSACYSCASPSTATDLVTEFHVIFTQLDEKSDANSNVTNERNVEQTRGINEEMSTYNRNNIPH